MKLSRRQLLFGGLISGVTATSIHEIVRLRKVQNQQRILTELALESPEYYRRSLQTALMGDQKTIKQVEQIQASIKLTLPSLPYDRAMSKRLIQCSRIGTEQYLYGKFERKYDGAIAKLPGYSPALKGYTQLVSIRGPEEAEVREKIEIQEPNFFLKLDDPIRTNLDKVEAVLRETAGQVVTIQWLAPVYWGFVLTAPQGHIIAFRGTQRTAEWLENIRAQQIEATNQSRFSCIGKVHAGFANVYSAIADATIAAAKQLDPTRPCYICGHSLGAAIATLAAMDLAIRVPKLKQQLRLYTYASPRVGDPAFAVAHSRLVPNSYRIANAADAFPLAPPTSFEQLTYAHVGQSWSFLSQQGDIVLNHFINTYRAAIDQERETASVSQ
jgi:predicted lipase